MCCDRRRRLLALALAPLLATEAGCLGDRCNVDQILVEGMCQAAPRSDAGGDAAADALGGSDSLPGADEGGTPEGGISGLGAPCSGSNPCTGEADYCVLSMDGSGGYCSLKDCQVDPNSCPPGYTCRDIRQFMPLFPLFCSNRAP